MRQPKPFFRNFNQTWYVQFGRKQVNLGRDKAAAFRRYHELMADRGVAEGTLQYVSEVLDEYLEWLQKHRSPATYAKALHYLTLFARRLGCSMTVEQLSGIHVTKWIESRSDWKPTTKNDAASLVQRTFRWAAKRGLVAKSPVEVVEGKPSKQRRETVLNPDQWKELRAAVKDDEFGELIDFMWSTGCRPIEARTVIAEWVDLKNAMIVFPPSDAKGKRHERVVFLPDIALNICERRMRSNPSGPIFINTKGRPWTKDAINCRFQRLKEKLPFDACAYAIRHSYATEGLKKGVDSLTLAQIMGHSDTSMLSKHYAHLARNPDYLRRTARKLNGE